MSEALIVHAARNGYAKFAVSKIARAAGVSEAVVRLVITGKPGPSVESKQRVIATIEGA